MKLHVMLRNITVEMNKTSNWGRWWGTIIKDDVVSCLLLKGLPLIIFKLSESRTMMDRLEYHNWRASVHSILLPMHICESLNFSSYCGSPGWWSFSCKWRMLPWKSPLLAQKKDLWIPWVSHITHIHTEKKGCLLWILLWLWYCQPSNYQNTLTRIYFRHNGKRWLITPLHHTH